MENASKALLIAAAILLSIIIISISIYIYNQSAGSTKQIVASKEMEMQLKQFNSQYELYEGIQSSNSIKQLLNIAIENNTELYKSDDTIELSVCIRSKSKKVLASTKDSSVKYALSSRNYGVRYPNNIRKLASYLGENDKYNISFEYNKNGYIWEIWINDIN